MVILGLFLLCCITAAVLFAVSYDKNTAADEDYDDDYSGNTYEEPSITLDDGTVVYPGDILVLDGIDGATISTTTISDVFSEYYDNGYATKDYYYERPTIFCDTVSYVKEKDSYGVINIFTEGGAYIRYSIDEEDQDSVDWIYNLDPGDIIIAHNYELSFSNLDDGGFSDDEQGCIEIDTNEDGAYLSRYDIE